MIKTLEEISNGQAAYALRIPFLHMNAEEIAKSVFRHYLGDDLDFHNKPNQLNQASLSQNLSSLYNLRLGKKFLNFLKFELSRCITDIIQQLYGDRFINVCKKNTQTGFLKANPKSKAFWYEFNYPGDADFLAIFPKQFLRDKNATKECK